LHIRNETYIRYEGLLKGSYAQVYYLGSPLLTSGRERKGNIGTTGPLGRDPTLYRQGAITAIEDRRPLV
jgi:hypothetical protein